MPGRSLGCSEVQPASLIPSRGDHPTVVLRATRPGPSRQRRRHRESGECRCGPVEPAAFRPGFQHCRLRPAQPTPVQRSADGGDARAPFTTSTAVIRWRPRSIANWSGVGDPSSGRSSDRRPQSGHGSPTSSISRRCCRPTGGCGPSTSATSRTPFAAATNTDVVGRTLLIGGDDSHRLVQGRSPPPPPPPWDWSAVRPPAARVIPRMTTAGSPPTGWTAPLPRNCLATSIIRGLSCSPRPPRRPAGSASRCG